MPNWCMTTFMFVGNKEEINVFADKINEWTSKEFTKTDFGVDWLGNILYGAGLEDRIDSNENSIRCRGNIAQIDDVYEHDDNIASLQVITESAWVPMGIMWQETIKALGLDSIKFCYEAEEPGCELYWIYDPDNLGTFKGDEVYIDSCMKNNFFTEYCSEEYAIKQINKMLDCDEITFDGVVSKCNEFNDEHEDGDEFVYLHKFEQINVLMD